MDQRLARAVTLAAALPLFLGCGPGDGAPDARGTPTEVSPSSASVPTGSSPRSDAVAPAAHTPGPDDAAQEEQVRAASRTFVRTVLTIGYPDRTYQQYTDRIEPLMTEDGFDALISAGSARKTSDALASLYAQRSRSAPRFTADPEVTSLRGDRATAHVAYENLAQRREGRGWRTTRSLGEGTATVRLVRQDEKWLVEVTS